MTRVTELERALPGLPADVVRRIAAVGVPRQFAPRQTVFRAGDAADGLYFVLAGEIRVSRETQNHAELLHSETAGGVLGEIPVFGGVVFPATAVAVTQTRCLELPIVSVETLLREHPEFARFALGRLAHRAQSLIRRIDELTALTITARIAQHLLVRAVGTEEFTLGKSQAALAAELGTAREVVVRSIAALIRLRAIRRVGRSRFSIVSLPTMRLIASGGAPATPRVSR